MDFEKVEKAIERAPQEVQELLFSEEVGKGLQEVAGSNNLDEEVTLAFVDEIVYIILGLKERSSLKDSLAHLKIPTPAAFSIIQKVNETIFSQLDKIELSSPKPAQEEVVPKPIPIPPTPAPDPIVITPENKESALKELDRRHEEVQQAEAAKPKVPEILPINLPMVEVGEVAHDVPHQEPHITPLTPPAPTPTPVARPIEPVKTEEKKVETPHYAPGKDPYREPLA